MENQTNNWRVESSHLPTSDKSIQRERRLSTATIVTHTADARLEFAFTYYRHLRRLRASVDASWPSPVQLSEIAADIGVSPSWLSRLFREKTGISFGDWLRHKRVSTARELLRSNDMSIYEVAYSVGFSNLRTFERSFKSVYGESASQFRKKAITQLVTHI